MVRFSPFHFPWHERTRFLSSDYCRVLTFIFNPLTTLKDEGEKKAEGFPNLKTCALGDEGRQKGWEGTQYPAPLYASGMQCAVLHKLRPPGLVLRGTPGPHSFLCGSLETSFPGVHKNEDFK